jgi:hypothetical protein
MKSKFEAVAMVRAKIRLKHCALFTEDTYCSWIRNPLGDLVGWIADSY